MCTHNCSKQSCFPIVPKLACYHLGLPIINPPKPITLLGGLTSFGGAGNNYAMHVSVIVLSPIVKTLYIYTIYKLNSLTSKQHH